MTRRSRSLVVLALIVTAVLPQFGGPYLGGARLLAQEEIGERRGERIAIQWAQTDSANYVVRFESVIPSRTVTEILEGLEDALSQYVKVFKFKPKEKFSVKFLDSLNTYEQEGGDPSHPGHYNRATGDLVVRQMPFYQLLPTVYHEAFHQYLQAYLGRDVSIPIWFNEGLAVYFEGMQPDKKTKKLHHENIDNRRLKRLQEAIFTRSALPLEKLVDADYEQFHDKEKEELHYSESFAFAYFLMQGMKGKPVFQYAETLQKTKDPQKAEEKIFGKERKNLAKMEKVWKQYTLAVKIDDNR